MCDTLSRGTLVVNRYASIIFIKRVCGVFGCVYRYQLIHMILSKYPLSHFSPLYTYFVRHCLMIQAKVVMFADNANGVDIRCGLHTRLGYFNKPRYFIFCVVLRPPKMQSACSFQLFAWIFSDAITAKGVVVNRRVSDLL